MYETYFGLTERPFSIAPDPQYLYMSTRHKEAMAHLSYGLSQGGCFIVLTGEVGTGKTTLCRNLLGDLPDNVDVALVLNANINEDELLQTICDELKIEYQHQQTQKQLLDAINQHLLNTFADNRHTVLIVDEAQLLSRDVLEKIRLLTNLETTKNKLLQIILIGQPELNQLLSRNDLRQLAQRVTARYHLGALRRNEIEEYVNYRLSVAGCKQPLFSRQALNKMHSLTDGIPRKINVLADHALLATYSKNLSLVDAKTVKRAAQDVFIKSDSSEVALAKMPPWWAMVAFIGVLNIGLWWWFTQDTAPQNQAQYSSQYTPVTANSAVQPDDNQTPTDAPRSAESISGSLSGAVSESQTENLPEPLGIEPVTQGLSDVSEEPVLVDTAAVIERGAVIENDSVIESTTVIESAAAIESASETKQADNESSSVTVLTSSAIRPGSVVVANEFLDASPVVPDVNTASTANSDLAVNLAVVNPERVKPVREYPDSAFSNALDTSADVTGRIAAYRKLSMLWQANLPDVLLQPICTELSASGLRCITVNDWAQLQRFNRPAILVLSHKNQLHRVVLQSANDTSAFVLIGDAVREVSVEELRARWTKQAVVIWRPYESSDSFVQFGDRRTRLPRLRLRINQALAKVELPVLLNVDSSEFDIDLSQKIFALQTRFGIVGDSKIGNETYLLMNEILVPDETPILFNRLR